MFAVMINGLIEAEFYMFVDADRWAAAASNMSDEVMLYDIQDGRFVLMADYSKAWKRAA